MEQKQGYEIIDVLTEHKLTPKIFNEAEWADVNDYDDGEDPETLIQKVTAILGEFTEVEHVGGGEGEGENTHFVIKFLDHDVYLRANGYYYSYDGEHFNGPWQQVFPTAVTRIEYLTQAEILKNK